MEYKLSEGVISSFRVSSFDEKGSLQDVICCPVCFILVKKERNIIFIWRNIMFGERNLYMLSLYFLNNTNVDLCKGVGMDGEFVRMAWETWSQLWTDWTLDGNKLLTPHNWKRLTIFLIASQFWELFETSKSCKANTFQQVSKSFLCSWHLFSSVHNYSLANGLGSYSSPSPAPGTFPSL